MAVYDKDFNWTPEAVALDDELRLKINPIVKEAFESGLRFEDIYYIACTCIFEEVITNILLQKKV